MTSIISSILAIFDTTPFRIFFALWTGIYLVQVLRRTGAISISSEILYIGVAFIIGLFVIPNTSSSS